MKKSTKKQVRELWDCCFDDSSEFTDLYFTSRYSEDRNIAIFQDEKVVSALQLLPYPMTFYKNKLDSGYISGAATFPEYRSQGIMKQLLLKTFQQMQQQGTPLSTLIPAESWLFNYYEKSGYATVFYARTYLLKKTDFNFHPTREFTVQIDSEYNRDVHNYIHEKLSEKKVAVLHTEEDFKVILADLALVKGELVSVIKENNITATAVVWKKGRTTYINELLADSEEAKCEILHYLFQQGADEIQITKSVKKEEGEPLGMLRLIDVKKVLDLYAQANPKKDICFNLTDSLIKENEGYYLIQNGVCSKEQRKEGVEEKSLVQLTEKLFTPLNPYMSLMLN